MSATNRGSKRNPYDFYATPTDVVENLMKNINLNLYGNRVLEPSAGKGNICRVVKRHYPHKSITALEINISCPNIKEGGIAFGTDLPHQALRNDGG